MMLSRRFQLKIVTFIVSSLLIFSGCGLVYRDIVYFSKKVQESGIFHLGRHGDLTKQEKLFAKIAWKYFEKNYNPHTGLVNAAENYPYTSTGEIAAYIAALVAAHQMEVIEEREFCMRIGKLIEWLNTMDLYAGELPNLIYNTQSGRMVGFDMKPGPAGFSAIDIGRLLIWLKVLKSDYPLFAEGIDRAVLRWNFCQVIEKDGTLKSGRLVGNQTQRWIEGRLGWEEYAARGYELWGLPVVSSIDERPGKMKVFDYFIPYDPRSPANTGIPIYITSTPFLLEGMEFHWDTTSLPKVREEGREILARKKLANLIYKVQEERYRRKGIMTARSENGIDRPPYAVIGTIIGNGRLWPTISRDGHFHYDLAVLSTRAIFGMWSLWDTPYTDFLMAAASCCFYDSERGWFEGRYEKNWQLDRAIVLETNAMVLEALFHKVKGRLVRVRSEPSYIDFYVRERHLPMADYPRCIPGRKRED